MRAEPWLDLAYVPRILPERPGWWPNADFDPEPVFAAVRMPVLLFYGEMDEWIPIMQDSMPRAAIETAVEFALPTEEPRLPGGAKR